MKLFSNYFDEIKLVENEVNCICFESSDMQKGFRETIGNFVSNKKSDFPYIILNDHDKDLTSRTMNIMKINGGDLNYLESKDYMKQLQMMLIQHFESNPILIKKYNELNHSLQRMLEGLSHSLDEYVIEFEFKEFLMEQLWKMIDIHLENETTKKMTVIDFRTLQIKSWLHLIEKEKPTLIIFEFPENDVTIKEIENMFKLLKSSSMTILCVSNSVYFMENLSKDLLFLVKENGSHYDLNQLDHELASLGLYTEELAHDELLISLAFHDFIDHTKLLKSSWKTFIDSSKH